MPSNTGGGWVQEAAPISENDGRPPLIAGRYSACTRIGRGGTSSVYVVFDHQERHWRAAKVLHADAARDPELVLRFSREAMLMTRLDHPNVIRAVDIHLGFQPPFLVMEFADAGSISRWSRAHGPMPPSYVVSAMLDLCRGLSALHAMGGVHRDIKPHNVLLDRHGRARLTDFGIVKIGPEDPLTAEGTVVGTLAFMAPEQRLEDGTVDVRADIFGIGATMLALSLGGTVPDPSRIDGTEPELAQIPQDMRALILRACAFDPAQRPQDVEEMVLALHALSVPGIPPGTPPLVGELPPLPDLPPAFLAEAQSRGLVELRNALSQEATEHTLPPRRVSPAREPVRPAPSYRRQLVAIGVVMVLLGVALGVLAAQGHSQVQAAEGQLKARTSLLVHAVEDHQQELEGLPGVSDTLQAFRHASESERGVLAAAVFVAAEQAGAGEGPAADVLEAGRARRLAATDLERITHTAPARLAGWVGLR